MRARKYKKFRWLTEFRSAVYGEQLQSALRSDVTADQERPYLLSTVSTFLRESPRTAGRSRSSTPTGMFLRLGPDICTHSMTFRFIRFCPHLRLQQRALWKDRPGKSPHVVRLSLYIYQPRNFLPRFRYHRDFTQIRLLMLVSL